MEVEEFLEMCLVHPEWKIAINCWPIPATCKTRKLKKLLTSYEIRGSKLRLEAKEIVGTAPAWVCRLVWLHITRNNYRMSYVYIPKAPGIPVYAVRR